MKTFTEELYDSMEQVLIEKGWRPTRDRGVQLLTDLVYESIEPIPDTSTTVGRFGTGDPNDRWQTYSPDGNVVMQKWYESLVTKLRDGTIHRLDLPNAIKYAFEAMEAELPNQGYGDTEPEWEMVDALNPVLDELGFKALEGREW